jgi:cytochrome c553
LVACSDSGPHRPLPGQVQSTGQSVSYAQVRPIFAQYCAACHPSRSQPDWLTYSSAKTMVTNGRLLLRIAQEKSMPPPGSSQAAAISDQDRATLAAWASAGGPLTSSQAEKPGDPSSASTESSGVVSRCFECHGVKGPGSESQPQIPRLAGQNFAYLRSQLENFYWGDRVDPSDTMNDVAYKLSDQDMDAVAKYYSAQPPIPRPEPVKDLDTFIDGRRLAQQYCNSCHMPLITRGATSDPLVPVLVGQSKQYLINQLNYFRKNERRSPLMHEFAKNLSHKDIKHLAQFFSEVP